MDQEEHFETLYLELYHKLLHYAAQQLDRDYGLAEEAVQDTFRIFWMKYHQVASSPNVRGWIVQTLKGEILNIRRTRARTANLVARLSAVSQAEGVVHDAHSVDLEYGDLRADPDYLLLREFALEQRTVKELAQSRGITIAACKKRLERARQRLKKYFEKINGSSHCLAATGRTINERGS